MVSGRVLGVIGCLLAAASPCWAESVVLTEPIAAGDCFQVQIDMKLTGEMGFLKGSDRVTLKMEADASHALRERILTLTATGLVEKTARVYDRAVASIGVGKDKTEKSLRPERKLIVAHRQRDGLLAYCPTAALTRSELDLTNDHFDLLSLTGLLPGKEVAVGETWKVPNLTVQGVCNFEGLTGQSVTGKLESITDGVALFSVTGTADGIDMGALVKLTIDGKGLFDLKSKRLVRLEWNQKDDREAGPISPATKVETHTVVTRKPIEQPSDLSDAALVSVPPEPKPTQTQLEHRDPKGKFELTYGREWQIVSQSEGRLIMRLMERGDFIAQVTITPWESAEKGKHMSLEQFRETMNNTPGWELDRELQAGEVPAREPVEGRKIFRLSMVGQLDGVPVMQNFYLITAPDGSQVVVAFNLTPKQADKLGARDLSLVTSMDVPAPPKK